MKKVTVSFPSNVNELFRTAATGYQHVLPSPGSHNRGRAGVYCGAVGRGQAVRRLAIPSGMCTMSRGERRKRLGRNKSDERQDEKRSAAQKEGQRQG